VTRTARVLAPGSGRGHDGGMASVDFFFGTGSRYSYLAAARVPSVEAETGATFRWRAVYSPDLIRRSGGRDPFAADPPRGQYDPAYRSRDAARWARLLGAPYREPDFAATDWRRIALWAAAADLLGGGAAFGAAVLRAAFGLGAPPLSDAELAAVADGVGLPPDRAGDLVASGAAAEAHERNLADALAAGAFGVPTFVAEDGEVFWGQDRVPLLVHHLLGR
jgi:2-hydroxychromene-2-carboxylate isomerase